MDPATSAPHDAAAAQARRDNFVRWDPADRVGHAESFFLKANAPDEPLAFWLKFTILAAPRGARPPKVEVWAVVFDRRGGGEAHVAAKETFLAAEAILGRDRFLFEIGPSRLEPGRTRGEVRSGGHEIAWDLAFSEGAPPLHLFPSEALYEIRAFPRTKDLVPHPDSRFEGTLRVDGREIAVRDWPGGQGHNWGRGHADRYAWALVNAFRGHPGTYFEGASARLRFGPIATPYLTLMILRHGGRTYDFRSPALWWNRSVELRPGRWAFVAASGEARLQGLFLADARDTVGLVYEDPAGARAYCLNSKIGRCRLRLALRAGRRFEHAVTLESADKAALELLVREEGHGVKIYA
jgi:hypothetical protein